MDRNTANQIVWIYARDKDTGAPKTGLADVTTMLKIDQAADVPVNGGSPAVEDGDGVYYHVLTQAETNGTSLRFKSTTSDTSAIIDILAIYTTPEIPAGGQFFIRQN